MNPQTPLVKQTICSCCPQMALGTGSDGKPYCHICRDWKSERHERASTAMLWTKRASSLTFDPDAIRSTGGDRPSGLSQGYC